MKFEWHDAKNEANIIKHGIDFNYAIAIFADDNRVCFVDERKPYGEIRFITIGTVERYIYVVVYTERSGCIRIISARRANHYERQTYYHYVETR